MRAAFKEWAIVVDALGRGEQILVLRKGGIHEVPEGFGVTHSRFLLFPTLYHQQRQLVKANASLRFDDLADDFPSSAEVRLSFFAEVTEWKRLESSPQVEALSGQHIWSDDVIAERFQSGSGRGIFVMAVRVFALKQPILLPMTPAYGGCNSWITLETEVDTQGARPVLSDTAYAERVERFHEAFKFAPEALPAVQTTT